MIKVSNIPPGSSEDAIKFFFENTRKSGGGNIEGLDYDEDSHTAIITFEDEDVAERVLSRTRLLFNSKEIDVECVLPRPPRPDGQAPAKKDKGDMPTEFVIEVRGIRPTTVEETIRYYFGSRRVANADIVKMQYFQEKEMYLIWFQDRSAIEAVMNKTLILEGQILHVKLHIPSPQTKPCPKYDNKVFITCMCPETTRIGLGMFLEARSSSVPEEIIFGETVGTALVTFDQPPGIKKLQTECIRSPLDGSHLSIHTVPITDCIVVSGLKKNISSCDLLSYFDNKKLSGVEGVREVKLVENERKCLVYFTDPDSAFRVCNRDHEVEGQILKIQLYYECLGQAVLDCDRSKSTFLPTLRVQNLNQLKIKFLLLSDTHKKDFVKQLLRHHAYVEWPDIKDIQNTLEVNCSLTHEIKDCRTLANTWAKTVKMEVEKFFSILMVKEIKTWQQAWEDVVKKLYEVNVSDPKSLGVFLCKENCRIDIVGHTIPVEELSKKIDNIIKYVAAEHDRQKIQITEAVSFNKVNIRLLFLDFYSLPKFEKEFEGLCVIKANYKKNMMILTGKTCHVNAAKAKLFEIIRQCARLV